MRYSRAWISTAIFGFVASTTTLSAHGEEQPGGPPPRLDVKYDSGEGVTAKAKIEIKPHGSSTEDKKLTGVEKFEQWMRKLAAKTAAAAGILAGNGEIGFKDGPVKLAVSNKGVDVSGTLHGSVPGGEIKTAAGLNVTYDHGEKSEVYSKEGEPQGVTLREYERTSADVESKKGKIELRAYTDKVLKKWQVAHADPTQVQRIKQAAELTNEFAAKKPAANPAASQAPAATQSKPIVRDAAILFVRAKGCSVTEWRRAILEMQQEFTRNGKPLVMSISISDLLIRDDAFSSDELNRMERHFRLLGSAVRPGEQKWAPAAAGSGRSAEIANGVDMEKDKYANYRVPFMEAELRDRERWLRSPTMAASERDYHINTLKSNVSDCEYYILFGLIRPETKERLQQIRNNTQAYIDSQGR